MLSRAGWLLVTCVGLAGCGPGDGTTGEVQPARTTVLAQPSNVLVPLPDGRLIAQVDSQLVVLEPTRLDLEASIVGPASEVGEVHAAVEFGDAILVLASGGTFIFRGSSWVPSPLGESFDGPIRDAVRLPTATGRGQGDLWIATESSLFRLVADGEGYRTEHLALEGDLSQLELAVARRPEGPALWVRLSDRVLEVWRDRTGVVRSAALVLREQPSAIAADAGGTGWLVIGGRLHSLGQDRRLVDRGIAVQRLLGSGATDVLWVLADGGAHVVVDGVLRRADGVDVDPSRPAALGVDGALYVSEADGVARLAPRHGATLEGPPDGALLGSARFFRIITEGEPQITATLDGAAVEALVDGYPEFLIDPAEIGDGSHALVVTIEHDDGTLPIVIRRSFEVVTNATWSADVAPLYELHCSACHGPDGSAVTALSEAEDWQARYEAVLINVSEGRMPLGRPPLTQREVALIEAWGVSGFPQ